MDKVSVIIPVYNKELFVKSCIASVIKQTYSNIDVVVVDDGSSDRSCEIVESMRAKDSRIVFIRGDHGGVSEARNLGLDRASGRFVIFVDADDELSPHYIERLVKYSNYDLVVSGLLSKGIYTTDTVETAIKVPEEMISASDIAGKLFTKSRYPIFSIVYTKMFRMEIIQKNMLRFRRQAYGEDSLFMLEYLNHTKNIKLLSYAGYINRIVPNTVSRAYVTNLWDQVMAVVNYAQKSYHLAHGSGWQYLYMRAIKLGLENECTSYFKFRKFCVNLNTKNDIYHLRVFKLRHDFGGVVTLVLLRQSLYPLMYILYRMRVKRSV